MINTIHKLMYVAKTSCVLQVILVIVRVLAKIGKLSGPSYSDTSHYCNVILGAMESQITKLTIVYSTIHSGAYKKHRSSASLAFVRGIHRWPVNSPHKWPVTRKMFPFDDVVMLKARVSTSSVSIDKNVWYFAKCMVTRWMLRISWYLSINRISRMGQASTMTAVLNLLSAIFNSRVDWALDKPAF